MNGSSKSPTDRFDTAIPVDDLRITIHCPARFAGRTEELLRLINHLYTQRSAQFGSQQAQRLADLITAQPHYAQDAIYAWQAMGKTVLPIIRQYYNHTKSIVRLAVLEAGARLGDETVSDHLQQLAQSPDTLLRQRAAKTLVYLPSSIRGARTLHNLLDDDEPSVRLTAYESLAEINDPLIQRIVIDGAPAGSIQIRARPGPRKKIFSLHRSEPYTQAGDLQPQARVRSTGNRPSLGQSFDAPCPRVKVSRSLFFTSGLVRSKAKLSRSNRSLQNWFIYWLIDPVSPAPKTGLTSPMAKPSMPFINCVNKGLYQPIHACRLIPWPLRSHKLNRSFRPPNPGLKQTQNRCRPLKTVICGSKATPLRHPKRIDPRLTL